MSKGQNLTSGRCKARRPRSEPGSGPNQQTSGCLISLPRSAPRSRLLPAGPGLRRGPALPARRGTPPPASWAFSTGTTRSAWVRTPTRRRTASCPRSTPSGYGVAAAAAAVAAGGTPSRAAAPACPAGPTPTWPWPTRSTRTQRAVGQLHLTPLPPSLFFSPPTEKCGYTGRCLLHWSMLV